MSPEVHEWIKWGGIALTTCTMFYSFIAWCAVWVRIRSSGFPAHDAPPVTILKPLCGNEPETYDFLRSFCDQSYREYQVVFGVADENDPVIAVVRRLQREFPQREILIAIDATLRGSNRKVSNLINMMPLARHDFLVIADSDVRVGRDYLGKVVAPLLQAGVGIVTCTYRGVPRSNVWSLLGSQFINEWFIPSVRVAALGDSRSFAFGVTIAVRRQVLLNIGGFTAIADQLADDYRLGELTRRLGLRTVLSEVEVETSVVDRSFSELVRHELRWLRTIRAVRPLGYSSSLITFGVPVAALGSLLAGGAPAAAGMLAATCIARLGLHFKMRSHESPVLQLLILPLRDLLSLALWSWSFVTRRVDWRNAQYLISRDGVALPVVV